MSSRRQRYEASLTIAAAKPVDPAIVKVFAEGMGTAQQDLSHAILVLRGLTGKSLPKGAAEAALKAADQAANALKFVNKGLEAAYKQ